MNATGSVDVTPYAPGLLNPSGFFALIGNSSPNTTEKTQIVNSTPQNQTIAEKAVSVVRAIVGAGPTTAALKDLSKGAATAGAGVAKAAGQVATSASSGIKSGFMWGVIILIVGGAIIVFAQIRRATG